MEESPGKMYALAIVLTLLAMLAVALRLYARRIKSAGLAWDDHMILPALVHGFFLGPLHGGTFKDGTKALIGFYARDSGLYGHR